MADLPELPATITVDLDTPLKRGDDAIATLTFRRPTTVVLLDMSLIQLGLVDMDVMRDLLTRTSTVGLIGEEVDKIDGADMLQIARDVSDFFQIEEFEDLEIHIDGDIVTIPLVKPIVRGETTLDELRLRRPDSGSFRSLSLARIGQMETRSLAGLLPRISMSPLTEADTYAAEPGKQRGSLHAFLVASICTLARPGAIVDINVAPDRQQWWPGSPLIDLNPHGRTQNKKHRALVPVLPALDRWLRAEYATYIALSQQDRAGRGWLVNYHGRPIQDVDRAWDTMLTNLELPKGREWRSYLLRHSLATLARNRGATKWDLEGFMGHSDGSQTEVYAIGEFPSVVTALEGIVADMERLAPGAMHRSRTEHGLVGQLSKGDENVS